MLYGVDIFCGAGGLSLGAEMAGIQIAFAVLGKLVYIYFENNHEGPRWEKDHHRKRRSLQKHEYGFSHRYFC